MSADSTNEPPPLPELEPAAELVESKPYKDDMPIFKVYADDRNQYFFIPPQFVTSTEGSERFLRAAPGSTSNPVLCRTLARGYTCPRGGNCGFIHADLKSAESSSEYRKTDAHRNDASEIGYLRYETMPSGLFLQIPQRENSQLNVMLPSEALYRTKGGENLYRVYAQGTPSSHRRYTRCNFFEMKKMCHKGPDCGHLHVAYDI